MQKRQRNRSQNRKKISHSEKVQFIIVLSFVLVFLVAVIGTVSYSYLTPATKPSVATSNTQNTSSKSTRKKQTADVSKKVNERSSETLTQSKASVPVVESEPKVFPTQSVPSNTSQSSTIIKKAEPEEAPSPSSQQETTTVQSDKAAKEKAREEQVDQLTKEYEAKGYNVNVVRGENK